MGLVVWWLMVGGREGVSAFAALDFADWRSDFSKVKSGFIPSRPLQKCLLLRHRLRCT
jgi:hypothetical protein